MVVKGPSRSKSVTCWWLLFLDEGTGPEKVLPPHISRLEGECLRVSAKVGAATGHKSREPKKCTKFWNPLPLRKGV